MEYKYQEQTEALAEWDMEHGTLSSMATLRKQNIDLNINDFI